MTNNVTYQQMEARLNSRKIEIRDAIFELSDIHDLSSCLEDSLPNMYFVTEYEPSDWNKIKRQYFDFELYDAGYDGFSTTFKIELPVEFVEEYDEEQMREWLSVYFMKLDNKDARREIRNDLFQLKHLLGNDNRYRRDLDEILKHIDDDKGWDDFATSYANKAIP